MPSGSRRCKTLFNKLLIVSTHVIYRARAPRMVSRPAEGGCLCLATVSVFSLCPASGAAQVQVFAIAFSLAQESMPRPLHSPAAFFLASEYATASSPAGDHACVCVCFILCYCIPYIAYVVSPAIAWRLYKVPIVSQSCE